MFCFRNIKIIPRREKRKGKKVIYVERDDIGKSKIEVTEKKRYKNMKKIEHYIQRRKGYSSSKYIVK